MSESLRRAPNRNHAFARALVRELARSGVRHACVSPGSRSTPLVAALAREPGIRTWSHVDERSAGFFGLGLARASGTPVALICTSGTAAANFLPAVVEAFHARVPLVVLTADRPPELRGYGAGQTIDQLRLYGSHVRAFFEAPVPEPRDELYRYARALGARLAATALGPPRGPVHANLPFREPLEPAPVAGDDLEGLAGRDPRAALGRGEAPYTRVSAARRAPDGDALESLARELEAVERGVLVSGPAECADGERLARACAHLARSLGWPVLADGLSPLRVGPHVTGTPLIPSFDALLRVPHFADAHAPDVVLRFGDTPTSKALHRWLEHHPGARELLVDPDGVWHDPGHRVAHRIEGEVVQVAEALAEAVAPRPVSPWLESFLEAERRAGQALDAALRAEAGFFEPALVRTLATALPEAATLFVSNSMPVRELDGFLPARVAPLRVMGQRGANGIDGIVSTALGVCAVREEPTVLLTGDLALLHDLGGLLAARRHGLRLTLVVVQNDGGGIFSYLPAAAYAEELRFEELFTTPHGLDLSHAARLFELEHARVSSATELAARLGKALESERSTLIEVPVAREASVAHHRRLYDAVARALSPGGGR